MTQPLPLLTLVWGFAAQVGVVVQGNVEFCLSINHEPTYWLAPPNCPFGVLFPKPVTIDCFASTEAEGALASVCKETPFDPIPDEEGFLTLQYIPEIKGGAIELGDTCSTERCGNASRLADASWVEKVLPPKGDREKETPWQETSEANENEFNQTQRLFGHLLGFVPRDGGPENLRVDVEAAFLYMLSEGVHYRIEDVTLEEFRKIDRSLNRCLDQQKPFKFIGERCKRYAQIDFINYTVSGALISHSPDEFSWKPELYDIPIDVTWATTDFVHGLCYGTFKDHVNSHHLYQQAMERLFIPEIRTKWSKPVKLSRPHVWDHFFSANVRTTIRNLEHCIAGAYYDAPFLHRLERMLASQPAESTGKTRRRRRREVPDGVVALPHLPKMQFHCFNTEEERAKGLGRVKASCKPEQDSPPNP